MPPWWQSAVVYQIYPRSFLDTDGDGVGDLEGIRRRLDHIAGLGVDAIWISPFFPSPMKDFGYDVADYCDVDPVFGTLADFDRLLAEAHSLGLRVLIDWVPHHTSDQHPWFTERPDWYIWRDGVPEKPPNNWMAAFTHASAWTWSEARGQWYLHLFLPEQPDLDWSNPEVADAMHGVLRFWLDRGVDGFRMDVIHCLGKDPALADDPPSAASVPHCTVNDRPETHPIIRDLRALLDSYPGERVMVGEVYLLDTTKVARYYGDGDELHLAFNFPPLYTPWDAAKWRRQIEIAQREHDPIGAWPTWVLSNHDNPRHRTRYGSAARARAAAVLLLTLRGTPFLYAGEEFGLSDADVPPEQQVDPGGRDGCRAPIPWDEPEDPTMLRLYQELLAARRRSPALQLGDLTLLDSPAGTLAYHRTYDPAAPPPDTNLTRKSRQVPARESGQVDVRTVAVNFTDRDVRVDLAGVVEVVAGRYEGGVLGPSAAVVLR